MPEEIQESPTDPQHYEVVGPKRGKGKKLWLVLLILALMATSAYGAWYYQQLQIDDLNQQVSQLKQDLADSQGATTETQIVKVQVVKSLDSSYSVELPEKWLFSTCEPNTILAAPASDLLGICASESGGLVAISVAAGDQRAAEADYNDTTLYKDVGFETLTINGLEGVKVSYTAASNIQLGPVAGTYQELYQLYDGTNTYIFTLTEPSGTSTDYRDDFESIVNSLSVL